MNTWRCLVLALLFFFLMSLAASLGFGQGESALKPWVMPKSIGEQSAPDDFSLGDKAITDALLKANKLKPKYPSVKINGKLEIFYADYFNQERHQEGYFGEIRFRPRVLMKFSDEWSAYVEGDFRKDNRGFARGRMNDWQEGDYRASANLREYYLEYNKKWFRARVGKQIIDWSVTDTVSPSDNINPRDWTHLIEWERVGVPAADVRIGYDTYLEAVFVPWFTPSKLPQGRWETTELEDRYQVEGRRSSFAFRGGTTYKGFDFTASYFDGPSYNPTVSVEMPPIRFDPLTGLPLMPLPQPRFRPLYFHERVMAITMAKEIFKGYTVRAEVGHFDQDVGHDFTQYVIGVDHEWSNVFRKHATDSLYLLVQYAGDTSSDRDRAGDIRRSLSDCVMVKAKYSPSDDDKWSYGLEGAYNTKNSSGYIKPSITWKKDNFKVEGGVAAMFGGRDSFFGQYSNNTYGFLALSWEF